MTTQRHRFWHRIARTTAAGVLRAGAIALPLAGMLAALPTSAQQAPGGWQTAPAAAPVPAAPPAVAAPQPAAPGAPPVSNNTTILPRSSTEAPKTPPHPTGGEVRLMALLTGDGQKIDSGIVWRVYEDKAPKAQKSDKLKLLLTSREAAPTLKLVPGFYVVNASFGRAHLTRKITVKTGAPAIEQFVLNAGGLRLTALVGTGPAPPNTVTYDILAGERDQSDNREVIISGVKPGLIIRLNAGIYHIVSTYGGANASVRADVTVEAGKLTEASVTHTAGTVTFKLVTRTGGEALPDTHWTVQSPDGHLIKESVGALPTHILAPGSYTVLAKSSGKVFRREFTVKSGDVSQVEVMLE